MLVWLSFSGALLPQVGFAEDEPSAAPTTPEPPSDKDEKVPAPEAPESDWIDLSVTPDFTSAVESKVNVDGEDGDLIDELQLLFAEEGSPGSRRPTARWGVRPLLGLQGAVPAQGEQATGGSAGLRVVHQWWAPTTAAVRPAGETRLQAAGLFGGVSGFDVTLDAVGGSWLGPVGVFGGGMARADRRSWTSTVSLPPAVGVGPAAQVAVRLGGLVPWAGASPAWLVAGERPGMSSTAWDELTLRGGVAAQRGLLQVRLGGSYREVHEAALWDLSVGLHLGVTAPRSKSSTSK